MKPHLQLSFTEIARSLSRLRLVVSLRAEAYSTLVVYTFRVLKHSERPLLGLDREGLIRTLGQGDHGMFACRPSDDGGEA
jgi:hypothetical protein